jgi:hypothetical protein
MDSSNSTCLNQKMYRVEEGIRVFIAATTVMQAATCNLEDSALVACVTLTLDTKRRQRPYESLSVPWFGSSTLYTLKGLEGFLCNSIQLQYPCQTSVQHYPKWTATVLPREVGSIRGHVFFLVNSTILILSRLTDRHSLSQQSGITHRCISKKKISHLLR